MRRRYVQINGELIEVSEDYIPEPRAPMVFGDIKPYRSMCDGRMVEGRAQHREHLKFHNVVEVGNDMDNRPRKPMTPPPGLKDRIIAVANERLRHK